MNDFDLQLLLQTMERPGL